MTQKRPTLPLRHRKTGETRRKAPSRPEDHLFEFLPDLVFRLDARGVFLEFMGGKREQLFASPKRFLGKPVSEVLPPDVAAFITPRIQRVIKSGKPATLDYMLPMPEGPQRYEARLIPGGKDDVMVLVRNVSKDRPSEEALQQSQERYHSLVELSPSAIAVHDGRIILYVNQAAADLLADGDRKKVIGRPVLDFVHPDFKGTVGQRMRRMTASRKGLPLIEERFLRTDGSPAEVEVAAASFLEGGRTLFQVIFRDIAQRKEDERAIVRLHRLNAFLSAMNQAIVRIGDRDELFRQICRIAIDKGGMAAAWVGLLDDDGRWVRPAASWGHTNGYPDAIRISRGRGPEGRGPTGRAIREGRVAFCNDIETDPAMAPWREEALRRGFRSSAAVPMRFRGKAIGSLNLYAPEVRAFGDQEIAVLEAVAADLEFALAALDQHQMRQEAEAALVESEDKFRGLFEHSKDGIYVVMADGRILSCNAAALRMFGYSLQELESVRVEQLYAVPRDLRRFREAIEREGAISNFDAQFRRKDGTVLDCLLSASIHRGPGGKILGYQGIIHDITERRRMEEALRSSEQRYRSIFAEGPLGMVVVGMDSRFIQVNARFCAMLGYEEAELIGRSFVNITHPDHVAENTDAVRRLVRGEIPLYKTEKRYLRKDGEVIWGNVTVSLVRDARGEPLFFHTMIEDITEQRTAREALRESERRLAQAQAVAHLGSYVFDVSSDRWTSSAIMDEIFGIDRAFPRTAEGWLSLMPPDDRRMAGEYLRCLLRDGGKFDLEYRIIRPSDGQERWVHGLGELEFAADGSALRLVGTIQDITERRKAEEELRIKDYAMASALNGIVIMDLLGRLTYANASCLRMWGYLHAGEVLGRPGIEFWADAGKARRVMARLRKQGCYQGELDARRRDGTIFFVEFAGSLVLDTAGRPLCYMGSFRDITEHRAAEAALRESEEQLRALSANLAEGMVYQINSGRDGTLRRMLYISPAVEQLHGLGVEEVLRNPSFLYAQIVEADQSVLAEAEAAAIADRSPMNVDVQVRLPSGELRWRRFISNPRSLSNGDVVWDGIELDITDRKQAGAALRESEEKYRTLVESARDAIFVADAETGFLIEVNRQAEILTGLPAAELVGRHQSLLHPPEERDRYRRIFANHAAEGNLLARDLLVRRADGTDVPVDISATTVELGGRRVVQGVFQDISDRKWAEKALQESLDMLQRGMQGTILAMMTMVEMRDPFTAGHQSRVARLACAIGRGMGMNEHQVEGLRVAGLLHDIGKIGVPAEILSKPGRILDFEYSIIKSHSEIGHKILKEIDFPWPVAEMVLQHHERLDGSGYPAGLHAKEIMLESRILVVADVVEAMASHRPYRPARGMDLALGEVELNKGILYDGEVVEVCLTLFREHHFTLD